MEKQIIVVGSLSPDKECQDRVRVLSGGGICQSLRATDYKDPPKLVVMQSIQCRTEPAEQSKVNTSTVV